MVSLEAPPQRKPRYPGEDTRTTSPRELLGWYSYAWAAEVFVVCGIGSFIPITLEQLARDRGVLSSDRKTPCKPGFEVPTALLVVNGTTIDQPLHEAVKANQCIIDVFGWEVNTASLAMYTFSFSVLVQALLIVTMSGAADHGRFRKLLLLVFAFVGSIATMFYVAVTSKLFILGAILAIISNASFGASFVLLNSFLPLIVRYHPSVAEEASGPAAETSGIQNNQEQSSEYSVEREEALEEVADSESALLNPTDDLRPAAVAFTAAGYVSPQVRLSTKISAKGVGIGYIGAITVQLISVALVKFTGGSTWSLRLVLFFIGAWWFIFTIPCIFWLRPRPGPPLEEKDGKRRSCLAYMGNSWVSLFRTIARARHLKDVMLFLAAWFLLSDAIATVSGTAILYAKTELAMQPAALALINVIVMVGGVVGAFTWTGISRLFKLKPNHTILVCMVLFELIPLYALLSYIPPIRRLGYFGLQTPIEMYPIGALYGLVIAGISAYCRALYGSLVPEGYEATFYALYAITDKGSSVFGPAVVGAITDAAGEIRPAFWFLAALIAVPFPLMYMVDVERGKRDGAALARELAR